MPNKITLKTIEDLNNNECRFPLGKETDPPKYFWGKVSLQDYSYCKKHLKICTKEEDEKQHWC